MQYGTIESFIIKNCRNYCRLKPDNEQTKEICKKCLDDIIIEYYLKNGIKKIRRKK